MRAPFALACFLGVVPSAIAQDAPRPSSTVVIEQVAASGGRLALAVLDCPEDRCHGVARLDADGASFGMAARIELTSGGATVRLRGCDPSVAEADCASYGTRAADWLYVPLGPDGYGRRSFHVGPMPPPTVDNTPGVAHPLLRWESGGLRFGLVIEIARRPK